MTQPPARRQEVAKLVHHYRRRNEPTYGVYAGMFIPTAFAITALTTGEPMMFTFAMLSTVLALVVGFWVFRNFPANLTPEITEFRSGDYPLLAYWSPVIGAFIPVLPVPFAGQFDIEVPPAIGAAVGGVYLGAVFALATWMQHRRPFMVGARRCAKILEDGSLEGITNERLDVAEEHEHILAALIAVGAVDGNTIQAKWLPSIMDVDEVEELQEPLETLASAKLIDVNRTGLYHKLPTWRLTIKPLGVRCLNQLRSR